MGFWVLGFGCWVWGCRGVGFGVLGVGCGVLGFRGVGCWALRFRVFEFRSWRYLDCQAA